MTVEAPKFRIGVIMSSKKYNKHNFADTSDITFLPLLPSDLSAIRLRDLRVTHILQKVIDLCLPQDEMQRIERELREWGGVVVDPLGRVEILSDRRETCKMLMSCTKARDIKLPPTGDCTNKITLKFPVIRKPVSACCKEDSHLMCLFPNISQITDDPNYILQQFIPHGAVLYKIYVIGEHVRIQLRPSIKSVEDSEPEFFDSQSLKLKSPEFVGSELARWAQQRLRPHLEKVYQFTKDLQELLQLTLFGWDLIIEDGPQNNLYVIDVNYFPGYDEVDLINLLNDTIRNRF